MSTELIRRSTIEEIVGYRNRALDLYAEAYTAIERADAAIKAAHEMAALAHPGETVNEFTYSHEREIEAFAKVVRLIPRDEYLRTARKLTDLQVWGWIVRRTDLMRLMDKQAKDQLRDQMRYVPEKVDGHNQVITGEEVEKGMPPITVENVYATLERFRLEADAIFKRGVANAFSKLDRRFRSHDGFKLGNTRAGNRIVLNYCFDDWGHFSWGSQHRDTLIDIERAFAVLDGDLKGQYYDAVAALDQDRQGLCGPKQSRIVTRYFEIRGFKNGNAHLWFRRPDLVHKVNQLLAEWYGEVIGDGQTKGKDPFADVKHLPAKYFGFYPTPSHIAKDIVAAAPLYREKGAPPPRVLEPSAGSGALARLCAAELVHRDWRRRGEAAEEWRYRPVVDCVEIQPHLAEELRAEAIYDRVWCQDFLKLSPKTTGLYDVVVMNPPFDRERDVDHVAHALKFLKSTGFLTAIMSAGTEFRETKKATAFRALMKRMNARWRDLPAGSFLSVGTNLNTVVLRVWKDGRSFY